MVKTSTQRLHLGLQCGYALLQVGFRRGWCGDEPSDPVYRLRKAVFLELSECPAHRHGGDFMALCQSSSRIDLVIRGEFSLLNRSLQRVVDTPPRLMMSAHGTTVHQVS